MPHRTDTDHTSLPPLMTVTGSTLVLASRTAPERERRRRRAAGPGPFARLFAHFRSRR
ncbi:hypothetical protein [Streptomyces sp. 150FB]|uniref:hypothetical protein n=1 Tax=Streptomyces sp. 150FB TaxID=1576605 RepID=UPI000A5769DC|nr:hypothetical protein [Streptomyces sp. 150FB]